MASCRCCPGGEKAAAALQAYPGQTVTLLLVAEIAVPPLVPVFWSVLERSEIFSVFLLQLEPSNHSVLTEAGRFPSDTLFCVC